MCIAVPGVVVALPDGDGEMAAVEISGRQYEARLGLLGRESLALGDWVLVYAGYIYEKIDAEEAQEVLELLAGMDEALLEAFADPTVMDAEPAWATAQAVNSS